MSESTRKYYSDLSVEEKQAVDTFMQQQNKADTIDKYSLKEKACYSCCKGKKNGVLFFNAMLDYCKSCSKKEVIFQRKGDKSHHKPKMEKCFASHGINLAKLQQDGLVTYDNDEAEFKTQLRRLDWEPSRQKYTWKGYNGLTKGKLKKGLYPPLNYDGKADTLYIMAGEWDMFRAYFDGLCCTSSLWGESYTLGQYQDTIEKLNKFKKVILVYDQGKDYSDFVAKSMKNLSKKLSKETEIFHVELPFGDGSQGKDYCDWRKNNSFEDFLKLRPKKTPPKVPASKPAKKRNDEKNTAEKTAAAAPKNTAKKVLQPQFIEEGNQTYYLKVDKRKKKVDFEHILHANFVMTVSERREDDDGRVSYLLDVENKRGEKKQVEITEGSTLTNPNRFDNALPVMGFFTLYDLSKKRHIDFIDYVLLKKPPIEKYVTQYIGGFKPEKYLYNNALVTKDGVQSANNIIPPKTKVFLHEPREDIKTYWRRKLDEISKVYGEHAWKIVGFCVASVWRREIFEEYNSFPVLKIGGAKGSGKSSLSYLITSMFGGLGDLRLKPRNATSTAKSYWRDAEKFCNIPLTLNEYKGTPSENQIILSSFDGEGVNRAKTTNDLQTHTTKVNCTLVVISTREISGYESAAVTSRCVDVDLKVNRDLESDYQRLSADKSLSSLPIAAMKIDVEKLIGDINAAITEAPDNQENIESRNQRNHAIFLASYLEFARVIGKEIDFNKEQENMLKSMRDKEVSTDLENYGIKFIGQIVFEISKKYSDLRGELAEFDTEGDLFFKRVGSILDVLKSKKTGDDLPGMKTITRDLAELAEKKFRIEVKEGKEKATKEFSIENKTFRRDVLGSSAKPFKGWRVPSEILENLGILDDEPDEETEHKK